MFDPIHRKRDFNYGVGSDGATFVKANIRFRGDWITCMGFRMGVYSMESSNQFHSNGIISYIIRHKIGEFP